MNIKKIEVIATTKNPNQNRPPIHINNETMEWVPFCKYLGTWITENTGHTNEIKSGIVHCALKKNFSNRNIKLELRARIFICYIFPTLLNGTEV